MGVLLLFLTTFIWGTAFLAQKFGADHLGPVAFTALRNLLGGLFLLAIIAFRTCRQGRVSTSQHLNIPTSQHPNTSTSLLAGIFCGIPLFFAMSAQQVGVQYTTPGICAFLTTNYVLFVPVFTCILTRKRPPYFICFGAALAMVGTYFICLTGEGAAAESFSGIGKGELWSLFCAVLFAIQMMVVDRFARAVDLLVMSAAQLFTCAAIGTPLMFLLPSEATRLSWPALAAAALPLIYCGVFSSGIAYTLQNLAQARTSASLAAIVLSMESVFGALSGWLVLHDVLSTGQFFGCALVLTAALVTQLLSARKG